MKQSTARRKFLLAAGAAALAAAAGKAVAQSTDIRGAVAFEGGTAIPKGQVVIRLEDSAVQDDARRSTETRVESDGKSKTIAFTLSPPAGSAMSPTLQLVARLERADGWLLARGSAGFEGGSPVQITLYAAIY